MLPITLSKRMQAIVNLVPDCETLADIGTDHGFIPIHAIQIGRSKRAIATDLRSGPLNRARQNIAKYGLGDVIDLRLGDGLKALQPGDADVIVTAGIGGHVHAEMVRNNLSVAEAARTLIFQPMNAGHVLRQTLDERGFHIQTERLVMDDDKIYEIVVTQPKSGLDPQYDGYRSNPTRLQLAYTYGPMLFTQEDPLFELRLVREVEKLDKVKQSVLENGKVESQRRIDELDSEIDKLKAFCSAWKEAHT